MTVATGLWARTERIASVDLIAWAGEDGVLLCRDGAGIAARGVACEIALPGGLAAGDAAARVTAVLRSIDTDDDVGRARCGAIAVGALPFDRAAPASLVVPGEIVGRERDGTCWRTVVGAPSELTPVLPSGPSPDQFTLTARPGHEEWQKLVELAVAAIDRGPLTKVVLAREVEVDTNRPIVRTDVLARLAVLYPSCNVFAVDGFLGASPELLVSRHGRAVRAQPLAGTIAHRGDPEADRRAAAALLASTKDRDEHQIVVDAVAAALRPHCVALDVPTTPSIATLRNVSHLESIVSGTLDEGAPSVLDLVAALHPTPAVAGTPTQDALAWLAAHEGMHRGHYAGPVGWVNASGDGEWVVGIRCAEINGATARLFAGVGIVADSNADAELAETQLKLQALLAALVRP